MLFFREKFKVKQLNIIMTVNISSSIISKFTGRIVRLLPVMLLSQLLPSPVHGDPFALIRAGRWEMIDQYFQSRIPGDPLQKYIRARALEEKIEDKKNKDLSKDAAQSIAYYLSAAGIYCRTGSKENDFLNCIKGQNVESISSLVGRLSLYRASKAAEKSSAMNLHYRLLSLVSLSSKDPLSRMVFKDRLEYLFKSGDYKTGLILASGYDHLQSPFSDIWRGKVFAKNNKRPEAVQMYFRAADMSSAGWIKKIVYKDLSDQYPDVLSTNRIKSDKILARALVPLTPYLDKKQLQALKSNIDYKYLRATARPQTVESDGLYLIEAKMQRDLPDYAAGSYTHISQNPEILYSWIKKLHIVKDRPIMKNLFKQFAFAKKSYEPLWRSYLDYLRKNGSKSDYFTEMLAYLKVNQSDVHIMDDLIEFLIGRDHDNIHWAAAGYWESARSELPHHNGSGRFYYWLNRYYEHYGKNEKAKEIQDTFYSLIPGSYYAQTFWDSQNPGDFRSDWVSVKTREDYLEWISRHGGNNAALQFLSTKDRSPFMDPQGVAFWNKQSKKNYDVPADIMMLFRLGETSLGNEFFDEEYENNSTSMENFSRLAYIGNKSNNLYISVYYTRRLLRELNIPEDPFSLPEDMLRDLYPRPYLNSVKSYANLYGIEGEMVYGLMRQESMFRETAKSRSGAMGLMQIMPRTGKWLANRLNLRDPNFFEPDISIRLGTKYFSDLIKNYDLDFRWAAIAYNGGPGNLRKWKRRYYREDFNLFLENIPVAEPRNYCRITYENYLHYNITYTLNRGI